MKKTIAFRLCIVIVISMMISVLLSLYFQVKSARDAMYSNSQIRIEQVSQVLEKNDADIIQLKEELKEDYFIRAEAAAYIVQNHPEIIGDQAEMKKIAALLQVDEFHLFDREGTLYAGSEPKYFNYTFYSGEQMQFFLPMLEDDSLKLCQEVMPNTAESKMMQYIAVWRKDKKGIVQIGMEPVRLLEAMNKNELSHIFSMLTAEKGMSILAVDKESGTILGATDDSLNGKNAEDMGFDLTEDSLKKESFTATIGGVQNYCVFKPLDHILVGVCTTYDTLYQDIPKNMAPVIISLSILSFIIILLIMKMLDQFIIRGIYGIIGRMKKIADGDLDLRVEVTNPPELAELGSNINFMVKSLLETTGKLSLIFQNVNIPIAVYEYNQDMKRVMATSRIGEVMMLSEKELKGVLSDRTLFIEKIRELCCEPYDGEKDVYLIKRESERYIKIKSYEENRRCLGILIDVTEDVIEKQQIKFERDIDILTGLSSRRALFREMEILFSHPKLLENAAILMTDVDNLKYVNDSFGHEYGDKMLIKSAELLLNCDAPNKMVARLSGDEFVLVMFGAKSKKEIREYLDQLKNQMLEAAIEVSGKKKIKVSMSGGYVFYPGSAENFKEMLHLADQTMYMAKRNKKGYFMEHEPITK